MTRWAEETLAVYRRSRSIPVAVLLSVLIQALQVGLLVAVASRLGLEVPPALLFALAPLASVAAMLPLSVGGLGVREGVLVALLAGTGVAAGDVVAVSLTVHGLTAAFALQGCLPILLSLRGDAPAAAAHSPANEIRFRGSAGDVAGPAPEAWASRPLTPTSPHHL